MRRLSIGNDVICLAEEWSTYLNYVRNLDFFDTPDYGYLHRLFMDALDRHGWQCDWIFDWNEKQVIPASPVIYIYWLLLMGKDLSEAVTVILLCGQRREQGHGNEQSNY